MESEWILEGFWCDSGGMGEGGRGKGGRKG